MQTTTLFDVHSRLTQCRPSAHFRPRDVDGVSAALERCGRDRVPLAVMGARHAMGGQPFLDGGAVLDMGELVRVRRFDAERGLVEVEAGRRWPELVQNLLARQGGASARWGIRQKQTGGDRLSLGGAVAVNAHGRGLAMGPLVEDVEELELVDATGRVRRLSRANDRELFRLVVGGYGLFGVVTAVVLRLVERRVMERCVALCDAEDVESEVDRRRAAGAVYGDFQFAIDSKSPEFLRRGVLSTYHPAPIGEQPAPEQRELSPTDWCELLALAHRAKSEAFRRYAAHYLATHGQRYWSDCMQLGVYVDGYHGEIDRSLGHVGSEKICELYVPRGELARFLSAARNVLEHADVVYGTVRWIERDPLTALAWAREPWVCVVFNLHTSHDAAGRADTSRTMGALYDLALRMEGSFYLTYGADASLAQVRAAYPGFDAFARAKAEHDPEGRFASDWWKRYRPHGGRVARMVRS